MAGLAGHPPLAGIYDRLQALSAELADIAGEAHDAAERLEEDPERLAEVVARRAQLHELRRKYAGLALRGLDEVMAFHQEARERLEELEGLDALASRLGQRTGRLPRRTAVGGRGAGPRPAPAGAGLGPGGGGAATPPGHANARFEVKVGGDVPDDDLRALSGEEVTFLLAANPGGPLLPLAKVASGGELARAMLALRLVLLAPSSAPRRPAP